MIKPLQFLSGGGEMGALCVHNRESSVISATDEWLQSLFTTLGILLNSKFPIFLFGGTQHVYFYNDAYRPSLGNEGKHPILPRFERRRRLAGYMAYYRTFNW